MQEPSSHQPYRIFRNCDLDRKSWIDMSTSRYTCDGCNRAVPRVMWEDDQYWTTDSSAFYCHGCWMEWTEKQGSLVPGMAASASTFALVFASAPAYDRMNVDKSVDEDMRRSVETSVTGKVHPRSPAHGAASSAHTSTQGNNKKKRFATLFDCGWQLTLNDPDGSKRIVTTTRPTNTAAMFVDKPYLCNKCGKRFKTPQARGKHLLTHRDVVRNKDFFTAQRIDKMPDPRNEEAKIKYECQKVLNRIIYKLWTMETSNTPPPKVDRRKLNKTGGKLRRHKYTNENKSKILDALGEEEAKQKRGAVARVSAQYQLGQGMLSRWKKKASDIHHHAGDEIRKRMFSVGRSKGGSQNRKYKQAEDKVYAQYKARRRRLLKVSARWISAKLRAAVKTFYPQLAQTYRATARRRQAWRKTYKVSIRRKTNTKSKSKRDRHPICNRYHHGLMRLKRATHRDRDARHGRFTPLQIYSEDQVPCPFAVDMNSTYADVGSKHVPVATNKGSDEKRFCTLHVIFRGEVEGLPAENVSEGDPTFDPDYDWVAAGHQPQQVIVFRGKGKRLKPYELAAYDPRVKVLWQEKAWVDTPTYSAILNSHQEWFNKHAAKLDDHGDRLIIKDNLGAQTNMGNILKGNAFHTSWFTPEQLTDMLAAVDDGFGQHIKLEMKNLWDDWSMIEENADKWLDGHFEAWEKRVLIQNFFAKACAIVFQKRRTLRRYHEHVGNYLGPNGEGKDNIKPGNDNTYNLGPEPPLTEVVNQSWGLNAAAAAAGDRKQITVRVASKKIGMQIEKIQGDDHPFVILKEKLASCDKSIANQVMVGARLSAVNKTTTENMESGAVAKMIGQKRPVELTFFWYEGEEHSGSNEMQDSEIEDAGEEYYVDDNNDNVVPPSGEAEAAAVATSATGASDEFKADDSEDDDSPFQLRDINGIDDLLDLHAPSSESARSRKGRRIAFCFGDEDVGWSVGTVIRQHTASKAARLNGTCVMYWVKIDDDMYSLDLRRAKYLDRAMYEGDGSPMEQGTWVFLAAQ